MDLPKRKSLRLREYDYRSNGAYFVTICTQGRRCLLSRVVGRGLAPAEVKHSVYGKIAEEQLLLLEKRYSFLKIAHYVIMPNHIHIIFVFRDEAAGASPRPTLMDIVCAYKSMTTLACKKAKPISRVFQTSFYDHVIRTEEDYRDITDYINNNPARWEEDALYVPAR